MKPTTETKPVILTSKGVTLADRLKLDELPLATTPGGKAFALKALHPSEHTIKTTRVPGGNRNSVALCCDMIETFAIENAGSTATVVLSPNILAPAYITLKDGANTTYGNFYNAAFGGSFVANPTIADSYAVMQNMNGRIANYRITSQSMTLELIAPAMSDQGTITSAQYSLPPVTVSLGLIPDNTGTVLNCYPDMHVYPEPVPQSQALLGTSAYTSKAREGCYAPLKLTNFKWQDFNDQVLHFSKLQSYLDVNKFFGLQCNTPLVFPYFENRAAAAKVTQMLTVPKLCGHHFSVTTIAGTAANVAIRVRVRQVVEITAAPSTLYAPLLEAPIPPDETALHMYMEVSSRLKDAYPASYNDLGTLFKKVSDIAKSVLPFVDPALNALSGVPGTIGSLATVIKDAAPAVQTVAKAIGAGVKRRRARKAAAKAQPKKNPMALQPAKQAK